MKDMKVYAVAFLIRFIYAVMQILTKAAFDGGMSTYVYVFYRQLIGTLSVAPLALLLERERAPQLSVKVCFKIFLLALVGFVIFLNTFSIGLDYTTTTSAAAMINSVPVVTFVFAVLFRLETIKIKRLQGLAKVAGLALCLGGILTMAFYKGPQLKSFNHHHFLGLGSSHTDGARSHSTKRWALGTLLMTISTTAMSLWMVLQGYVLMEYPAKLLFTTHQCLCSTIQSFFIALAFERDFSRWKLGFNMNLLSVAYGGIVATAATYYLQSWTIEKKGPVFCAMTSPITLIIQIICSSFLLGEMINLGSILSGVFMVGGLYCVLWGKSREEKDRKMQIRENEEACLEEKEAPIPA
ncbi:WAT1-related protein At5g64700-like [Phoenix dactylifera]|uniref:WAT1-related protein n=1 Tax=Phoenix dactylifera TaxID=42345 RepID=A0A8B7CP65_PHODC|nr:WAT1-related protein At5g64700-like [Phoenix dactylifera]